MRGGSDRVTRLWLQVVGSAMVSSNLSFPPFDGPPIPDENHRNALSPPPPPHPSPIPNQITKQLLACALRELSAPSRSRRRLPSTASPVHHEPLSQLFSTRPLPEPTPPPTSHRHRHGLNEPAGELGRPPGHASRTLTISSLALPILPRCQTCMFSHLSHTSLFGFRRQALAASAVEHS